MNTSLTRSSHYQIHGALSSARDAIELMDTIDSYWYNFSEVNYTSALYLIARHYERSNLNIQRQIKDYLDYHETRFIQVLTQYGPAFELRNLSNLAWSAAKLTRPHLLPHIVPLALAKLSNANPQDLCNLAWASATLHDPQPALMQRISQETLKQLSKFSPQGLSNLAWAYATLKESQPALMQALAQEALKRLPQFTAQGLNNLAWAFATLRQYHPLLMHALARGACRKLSQLNPQELSNLACAFASLQSAQPVLFDAITNEFIKQWPESEPDRVCSLAWALSVSDSPALSKLLDHFKPEITKLSNSAICQLMQGLLTLRIKRPLSACQATIFDETIAHMKAIPPKTSGFEVEVLQGVTQLCSTAVAMKKDHLWGPYRINLALITAKQSWAIEVNGPSHYLSDGRLTGADSLKGRLLQANGWQLILISYKEWDLLSSWDEKLSFLKLKLLSSNIPIKETNLGQVLLSKHNALCPQYKRQSLSTKLNRARRQSPTDQPAKTYKDILVSH